MRDIYSKKPRLSLFPSSVYSPVLSPLNPDGNLILGTGRFLLGLSSSLRTHGVDVNKLMNTEFSWCLL